MCKSLVIASERYLVTHNIHIIRLVLNPTSAEDVGVIQFAPVYLVRVCTFFSIILSFLWASVDAINKATWSLRERVKKEGKQKRNQFKCLKISEFCLAWFVHLFVYVCHHDDS